MLDNFGLGEFFFLAMLALLFFGPERLPQIGARLGRWVGSLTQYSKTFLTEWREEALAIHDAVEEVKGIRDEIVAARAELSSTLDIARDDLTEGVDAAKEAISGATRDVTQRIETQRQQATSDLDQMAKEEKGEVTPDGSGEREAIERTQQILDTLIKKRDEAGDDGTGDETAPEQVRELLPEEDEWERNRRFIEEEMAWKRETDLPRSAYYPGKEETEKAEVPESAASKSETTVSQAESVTEQEDTEAEDTPEQPKETPFERTQRILEDLRRKRAGEIVEEPEPPSEELVEEGQPVATESEEEEPARTKQATAFDRTQEILQDLMKKRGGAQAIEEPAGAVGAAASATAGALEAPSIDPAEFERLSTQVTQLRDEMAALRQELQALRAAATRVDESTTGELPVEEAA
jgi:Sec-independent protein translocase protein TatA/outer membrane murein-binding lipoprotein Lpp